ncbi:hypothetical protein CEN49_26965 [Fischerella thermalis CCMEE 5273]|nr:hypothetical protein CEN49_26965 [Fischerella thermalis CCMEE 5273]
MATIQDIARKAGVSVTTVSRVLNQHPYVSQEKRDAVDRAIRELKYTPNALAVNLQKGKTQMIAVVTPMIHHPFFSLLIDGMGREAIQNQYQLVLCQTVFDQRKELAFLNMLQSKKVDGIILTEFLNPWEKLLPYLSDGPMVICNTYHEQIPLPFVYVDHYQSALLGLEHLVQQGYRKIAICRDRAYKKESVVNQKRGAAYYTVLDRHHLPRKPEWELMTNCGEDDIHLVWDQFMQLSEKPEAIFTGSDQLAAGIYMRAKKSGYRIPEDLAIMGFDNHPIAEILELSTIEQPIAEMGRKAVRLLHESIHHPERVQHHVVERLPYRLISRAST